MFDDRFVVPYQAEGSRSLCFVFSCTAIVLNLRGIDLLRSLPRTSPRRAPSNRVLVASPLRFSCLRLHSANIISKRHSYISIHTHSNHGATASRVQHHVSLVVITSRRARRASSAGSALPTEREPPERLAGSRVLHFRCRAFCLSRDSSGGRPRPPPCSTAGLT